eukprot:1254724-Pleurochrysis_carterae.AAC.1
MSAVPHASSVDASVRDSTQGPIINSGNHEVVSLLTRVTLLEKRVFLLEHVLQQERLAHNRLERAFVPIVLGLAGDIREGSTHFARSLLTAKTHAQP